jgi:hypothetical protein
MAHWLVGMGLVTVALGGNRVGHWNFALGVDEFTGELSGPSSGRTGRRVP